MEIKENMYIRTKDGRITKIKLINTLCDYDFMNDEFFYKETKDCFVDIFNHNINKKMIIDVSNDILDLIKPLDLMYIDIDPYDGSGGIVVPRIAETMAELNKYKELIKNGSFKLISITTCEKINNNSYKVGE